MTYTTDDFEVGTHYKFIHNEVVAPFIFKVLKKDDKTITYISVKSEDPSDSMTCRYEDISEDGTLSLIEEEDELFMECI